MKRFLYNFIWFLLFNLVIYILLIFIYGSIAPERLRPNMPNRLGGYGHLNSRVKELNNYKNIDILFIGSSHAYRGFDVRLFQHKGLKVFNLGSSAQTPIQSYILLTRYIDKLNPKLIVYDVYPETFSIDGVESALDVVSNDKNDLLSLNMIFELNNIKLYNTYIYSLLLDLKGDKIKYQEPIRKKNDTYISGGYVQKDLMTLQLEKTDTNLFISNRQVSYFKEIIHLVDKKNKKLLLVQTPVIKSKYELTKKNESFSQLIKNYHNYIDFNQLLNLNDSLHFYDSNHMNQNGVELFNNLFIDYLKYRKFKISN